MGLRQLVLTIVLGLALVSVSTNGIAATLYQHDNGTPGGMNSYGGNNVLGGEYFTTLAGASVIDAISVYWGQAPGTSVTLGVIDDPNGDQNLADGVVLQTISVNPAAGDIGSFVTYPIPLANVSAGFFVAAYIENGPGGNFPIDFDTSTGNLALGFSRGIQSSGTLLELAQFAIAFEEPYFMIRAESQGPSVPEPGTMVLLGSGLLGLWGARRKFKK